jgi:hypothetical protein
LIQRLVVCLGVMLVALGCASTATAAECGEAPSAGGEPLLAALDLDGGKSDTEYTDGDKRLVLRFAVSGCTLSSSEGIEAEADSSELDPEVFGEVVKKPQRSLLVIRVPVDQAAFEPGRHKAWVMVGGSAVTATTIPISVQKPEGLRWPLVIGLIAWILGCVAAVVAAVLKIDNPQIRWGLMIFAVGPAAAAAAVVWKTSYLDVDVWKLDFENGALLAIGVFSAALGGAAGALVSEKIVVKRRRR